MTPERPAALEVAWLVIGIADAQGDRLDRELLQRWAGPLGIADLLAKVLRPRP